MVGRKFKRKVGHVEVGILEVNGIYAWEYTNFGTNEERSRAIDKLHKIYHFANWG